MEQRMVFPRMRATVAGLLFLAWIGFLAAQVIETRGRILVSAPQIRHADVVVIATLTDDDGVPASALDVKRVLSPANVELAPKLIVPDIALISKKTGWQGPGDYVVPLSHKPHGQPGVALVPMSPGYYAKLSETTLNLGNNPDNVLQAFSATLGVKAERLREIASESSLPLFNIPITSHTKESDKFVKDLEKDGITFLAPMAPGEAKIYRATPEVIAQVEAILAEQK